MVTRRHALSTLAVAAVAVAAMLPTTAATADETPPNACAAWDIDYALAGMLQLSDTPMGAGNGTYAIGPGRMTLRFANVGGRQAGPVELRAYAMREHFEIESHALMFTTHVLTDSSTTIAPNACGVVAKASLEGTTVRWLTAGQGYRTDGTLTCTGSLCGKFGAPPPGRSELHVPPHAVLFKSLQLAPDMKTFTMPATWVAKTDQPKQTAHLALAGREMQRTCVQPKACP